MTEQVSNNAITILNYFSTLLDTSTNQAPITPSSTSTEYKTNFTSKALSIGNQTIFFTTVSNTADSNISTNKTDSSSTLSSNVKEKGSQNLVQGDLTMARSNSAPLEKNIQSDPLEIANFTIHQIMSPDSSDTNNSLLQFSKSLSANDFHEEHLTSPLSAVEVDIKPSLLFHHKQQMEDFNNNSNDVNHNNNNGIKHSYIHSNTNPTSPLNNNNNNNNLKYSLATNINNSMITMTSGGIKEDKVCAVCGDRALGCNFDAVSCESCKAFFRRNAHKENEIKCLFDGCCFINIHTRRFCSYCRLKQCIAAGMKKDLILGTEEKKKRMELVKQNRKRKVEETSSSSSSSPLGNHSNNSIGSHSNSINNNNNVPTTPTTTHVQPHTTQQQQQQHSPMYIPPQIAQQQSPMLTPTTASANPPAAATTAATAAKQMMKPSHHHVLHSENTNLLTMSRHDHPVASSLTTMTSSQQSSNDQLLVRKLSAEECHMLIELNQVYDLSFTVDVEPLVHITQLNPSLNQIVNQSSITVLRLIKFAKRLDDFVKLTQDLQISILKGCWFHLLLLRPVSLFDADRDVWATPKGDIPTEILKNATGYVDLHDDHIRYCRSLKALIGNDVTLLVILLVLVLFSPDGPHVIAPEIISNIQDRYLVLLKHYLEAKYTFKRSADMFPRLLSKIRDLNSLADTHAKVLMDINPHEIEPIMVEILDLKSC